jgi:hypothetical protein
MAETVMVSFTVLNAFNLTCSSGFESEEMSEKSRLGSAERVIPSPEAGSSIEELTVSLSYRKKYSDDQGRS